MLRISRLTDYATVILASLAGGALASAADIAERTHIGLPTVSKLLKELQHAGLVRSVRGAHGGYQLVPPGGVHQRGRNHRCGRGPGGADGMLGRRAATARSRPPASSGTDGSASAGPSAARSPT